MYPEIVCGYCGKLALPIRMEFTCDICSDSVCTDCAKDTDLVPTVGSVCSWYCFEKLNKRCLVCNNFMDFECMNPETNGSPPPLEEGDYCSWECYENQ